MIIKLFFGILTWRPLPDFIFCFISQRLLQLDTSFLVLDPHFHGQRFIFNCFRNYNMAAVLVIPKTDPLLFLECFGSLNSEITAIIQFSIMGYISVIILLGDLNFGSSPVLSWSTLNLE